MILAVDTGGTKTLVARFSTHGALEDKVKFPTPADVHEYLEQLAHHLERLSGDTIPRCISIALPDVTTTTLVKRFSNLPWKNLDIVNELAPLFPKSTILLENDANLGGLGEVRSKNPTPERALYVTLSTGIGTGFILGGQIDPTLRATEGGHIMLEYDGILREWEKFASGKAIFEAYGKHGSEITSKRVWLEIAKRFSRGFLTLVPLLRPDTIIIGGSMGTHFAKYQKELSGIVRESLPPVIPMPRIVQAKYPEEAVIYGCYYNAIDAITD